MDPSLMDDTCVCPECLHADVETAFGCRRCGRAGYIPCEEVQLGEEYITMLDEREDVFIVNNGDGTYTAVHPPKE